jgi:HEAT repeat protein
MPVPAMDTQVVNALVQAATTDESVNVRLAAIDALTRLSGNASVRQSMVTALGKQESPMVQAALIDYLVDAKDKQALPAIQELSGNADVDPSVRQRAKTAVGQLVQYK